MRGRWWRWKHLGIRFQMGPKYFVRMAPMFILPEPGRPANDNGDVFR